MQRADSSHVDGREKDFLRHLGAELRAAIRASFSYGRPDLAVALDTARNFIDAVLWDPDPTPTRIALARVRAELSLQAWRTAIDLRH